MLKKENRLTKNNDFDNVWKNGKSSFDKVLGIKIVENKLKLNRFGILVGLKISKKAVDRNTIKRRIRALLRKNFLGLKTGFDITIATLPPILLKNSKEIEASLKNNFSRLKILK